ncbi:hypothetical protein AGDE_03379 [Angomonas deanei]|nr:hypothetical protein AGDE_03379 [Angomonas deanei]|eukprot:EPY40549.1 hypothetical protein AGDE_03379 [Angomonas deanei]
MSVVPTKPSAGKKSTLPAVKSAKGHKKYHHCNCYGHEDGLPNYKLLAMPRTNNYYAAVGGCPCIPRVPAHPGSWRVKEATLRSSTYRHGNGCINKSSTNGQCCVHSGYQYGYKPGPHTVHPKNTADSGKCDTFGNMAFKSRACFPADNISDMSSVSPRKLEDLEALILEEHQARLRAEEDLTQLAEIKMNGTQDQYKNDRSAAAAVEPSEAELEELLREVKSIVNRPLHQTNIDELRRLVKKHELQQQRREYLASKKEAELKL